MACQSGSRLPQDATRSMTDIILEKINEVHIRVRTDDMGILKELSDFFTFFVPGYKFMPSI
jgi:hypothetical protein